MRKKYFIFGGVGLVSIILLLFFAEGGQHAPQQKVITVSPHSQTISQAVVPTISLPPLSTDAKEATKQFYLYDISSEGNPLANGAYKSNPYLSPEFKTVISEAYSNGNAPIFCLQNKRQNIVVGKEQTFYSDNTYLKQETISEGPSGTKDLYNVALKNVDGKWLIFDVSCRP